VALDWTDVRSFQTLMAAAVLKGRAVPLLWASYAKWELFKSRNALEEGLLHLLRTLIPERVPVILLADRGFGRVEMARACHNFGFRYLIRIKPDAWIEHPTFHGKLKDYPVVKGMRRVLQAARHRKSRPVTHNIVVRWQPGLPAKRDEPWYLMTDLAGSALQLTALYAKRMTVEELFRDGKSQRNGFALRQVQVKQPRRLDRLLLIVALAYFIVSRAGFADAAELSPRFLVQQQRRRTVQCLHHRSSSLGSFTSNGGSGDRCRERGDGTSGTKLGMTEVSDASQKRR
jgi:hypothetical protein